MTPRNVTPCGGYAEVRIDAVNEPCGHSTMCIECATKYVADNGMVCSECASPAVLRRISTVKTCDNIDMGRPRRPETDSYALVVVKRPDPYVTWRARHLSRCDICFDEVDASHLYTARDMRCFYTPVQWGVGAATCADVTNPPVMITPDSR